MEDCVARRVHLGNPERPGRTSSAIHPTSFAGDKPRSRVVIAICPLGDHVGWSVCQQRLDAGTSRPDHNPHMGQRGLDEPKFCSGA